MNDSLFLPQIHRGFLGGIHYFLICKSRSHGAIPETDNAALVGMPHDFLNEKEYSIDLYCEFSVF